MPKPKQNMIKRKRKDAAVRRERACVLLASGWAHKDVAAELGVNPAQISIWLTEPDVAAKVEELKEQSQASAIDELEAHTLQAAKRLVYEMEHAVEAKDRIKAAESVLDRTGLIKGKRIEHNNLENLPLSALKAQLHEGLEAIERLEDEDT